MMIRCNRIDALFLFVALIITLVTLTILTVTFSDDLADGGDLTNIPSKAARGNSSSLPDIELLYYQLQVSRAPEGSTRKLLFQQQLDTVIAYRKHVDNMIELIAKLLFGIEKAPEILNADLQAQPGKPLVDSKCHEMMVEEFETRCAHLCEYGLKHTVTLANFCNAGVSMEKMAEASSQACTSPHVVCYL